MKKNWTRDTDFETKETDIIPLNDLAPHFYKECWCLPKVHKENNWSIYTHNSLDKREEVEEIVNSAWVC